MLCEICQKNEATIHIQEIVGGKKKSMHLCSSCAAAKQQQDGLDFGPFNLAGLLYKLSGSEIDNVNMPENADSENNSGSPKLVCPVCSWDERRLRTSGKLGCENCYRVFGSLITGALKNMHRGVAHLGKHPSGKGTELCALHSKLSQLQRKLQQAVEVEDYETAALYRDQINELKKSCEELANSLLITPSQ